MCVTMLIDGGARVPRVALVGPMGVGKSTVGLELSKMLNVPFVDLDEVIERDCGMSVPAFIRQYGESEFRNTELNSLTDLTNNLSYENCVLATGGGVVVTPACRDLLRLQWNTVWLDAGIDTLLDHLSNTGGDRPLLQTADSLRQRVSELVQQRKPWYEEVSLRTICVDQLNPFTIAKEISAWF